MQVSDGGDGKFVVDGSDLIRWRRMLGEDQLPWIEQGKLFNTMSIVLSDYMKLLEAYKDKHRRLEIVVSPLNHLAEIVATYRETDYLPSTVVAWIVETMVDDFDELNTEVNANVG